MTLPQTPDNWRKSSRSQNTSDCVEVALNDSLAAVRDTKDRNGGTISVPAAAWAAFTDTVHGQ